MEKIHTIVIGAGPGGLACAARLAGAGIDVLLLERKKNVGPKVCAGGVTWSGLSQLLPPELIERTFPTQNVLTNWQKVKISSARPIICTVDRGKLGRWMLDRARKAGAIVRTECPVIKVHNNYIQTKNEKIGYQFLVGADGSSSLVRRHLGLDSRRVGTGINCFIGKDFVQMEWHLDSSLFHTGYAWIFPHKDQTSIGAYACRKDMPAGLLMRKFSQWAEKRDIKMDEYKIEAALVNFDYQGLCFDNIFLVGDAAGLASGLTGEGIYPAIISGEAVASLICDRDHHDDRLFRLLKKHRQHSRILEFAGIGKTGGKLIMESLVFALRTGIIPFNALEMGDQLK